MQQMWCWLSDDTKVNEDIYSACKCLRIPVNTASNQQKCDFHFPGILEYEGVVLGFNGSGKDHKKVKEVREKPGKPWNKSERKKKNAKNNHWKPGEQTGSGAERNGEKGH